MPFSLAECILRYRDPEVRRRLAAGAALCRENGNGPGGEPGASAAGQAADLARVRTLFGEVSREWGSLLDAVKELKRTLEPEDFEEAMAAAGLVSLLGGGVPAEEGQPDLDPVDDGGPPPAGAPPSGPESAEVHSKLTELVSLLKAGIATRAEAKDTQPSPIPRSVALEFANEIAGRVKDSLSGTRAPSRGNEIGRIAGNV